MKGESERGGSGLQGFGAYQKALELFDLAVGDCAELKQYFECYRLVGQQIASADSIPANIEEGYGRESSKDYSRFLIIARGSAQETRGRYLRLRHWLPEQVVADRVAKCDEIIAILTKSITRLRSG